MEAAKDKVYASWNKFKGCSWSKQFWSSSSLNTPKCQNLNKDIRKSLINDIKKEIENINCRISFKEKRVSAA